MSIIKNKRFAMKSMEWKDILERTTLESNGTTMSKIKRNSP
jgi:hypothetical protein